jgi:hypothetical protein
MKMDDEIITLAALQYIFPAEITSGRIVPTTGTLRHREFKNILRVFVSSWLVKKEPAL